ncbi:hypothetical protein G7046_g10155 [Stylonectria norvegica]|nr:hypothetical protein G7046_g10155 [Stylonectria norvegica]
MILNLRPASVAALNTVIEDMGERFDDDQQEAIVTAIADVLGQFPAPVEPAEDGQNEVAADVAMGDATAA